MRQTRKPARKNTRLELRSSTMHRHWTLTEERDDLARLARARNWGPALVLLSWLHLVAFSICYYLTIAKNYHDSLGYLAIWIGELAGMWLLFRACGGPRSADTPRTPLELFLRRVWIAYFILAFNLGSLNTLRGHELFEFFPAMASLASFAFIMMAVVVDRRFFGAVVVLFFSGLLMAAYLMHAYLIFAIAWWLVLNGIGLALCRLARLSDSETVTSLPPTDRRSSAGTSLPAAK